MPVIVVPRSAATVGMDTFITELSNVIRNWLAASTVRTRPAPERAGAAAAPVDAEVVIGSSWQADGTESVSGWGDSPDQPPKRPGDGERPGPCEQTRPLWRRRAEPRCRGARRYISTSAGVGTQHLGAITDAQLGHRIPLDLPHPL